MKATITTPEILDVLTKETRANVIKILATQFDDIEAAKLLKATLRREAKALETIGLVPDYTAYLFIYVRNQLQPKQP